MKLRSVHTAYQRKVLATTMDGVGRVHSVVHNASAASAVTLGTGHMLSEKSQRTQNGTMFVDLE